MVLHDFKSHEPAVHIAVYMHVGLGKMEKWKPLPKNLKLAMMICTAV